MALLLGKEELKREIGIWALTLAIINLTVGSGIFIIPAIVAENLGSAAIIAYLICGVLIFLIGLCFAEVGSKISSSGGPYAYIETAFGPFIGFLANNIFWFGCSVLADAAISNALADTLKIFLPILGNPIFRISFFLFLFGGLAFINIRGVKNGVRFIKITAFAKVIPLLLLVIVGISSVSPGNLQWNSFPGIANLGTSSLFLFFAFTGIETAVVNGGEIKNPNRTVPLGILFGISFVLILYASIQLVTQGVLGTTILTHKDAPLAATAAILFGKVGIILMIAATALSMFGGLGGAILANPRILYAGAKDGLMPKVFGKVHQKFLTPYVAIAFYTGLGFIFAISGGFKQLAILVSASTLLIYLGVVLAAIKLRKTSVTASINTFCTPGGIVVPILALCAILWLLSNLTKREIISLVTFIGVFSVIYLLFRLSKKTLK